MSVGKFNSIWKDIAIELKFTDLEVYDVECIQEMICVRTCRSKWRAKIVQ